MILLHSASHEDTKESIMHMSSDISTVKSSVITVLIQALGAKNLYVGQHDFEKNVASIKHLSWINLASRITEHARIILRESKEVKQTIL